MITLKNTGTMGLSLVILIYVRYRTVFMTIARQLLKFLILFIIRCVQNRRKLLILQLENLLQGILISNITL